MKRINHIVFVLIVLLFLIVFCGCGVSGYVVTGKPTIKANQIDTILCTANSPACGTGASMYDLGVAYSIDPIYALAWFKHESNYGTKGVARVTRSLGNIECSAGYNCYQGYRSYGSYYAGYKDWYQLIANLYVQQWRLTTVDAILNKYAPQYDAQGQQINDTPAYISDIETSVDTWRGGVS